MCRPPPPGHAEQVTQQLETPASTRPKRPKSGWPIAIGLIVLSLVPVIAGAFRVNELTVGAEITEANARFFHSPVPVIAHVIGASIYLMVGALQFVPGLRTRRWHRYAGRVLVPAGIVTGLSGIWMAVFYPRPALDTGMRVFFGVLMVTFIALGLRAILRRDVAAHRAWMIRGYAIGIGAGTQVLTALVWSLFSWGVEPQEFTEWLLLGAGWVINLIVAEFAIRRSLRWAA
jgi:hypothetical protein